MAKNRLTGCSEIENWKFTHFHICTLLTLRVSASVSFALNAAAPYGMLTFTRKKRLAELVGVQLSVRFSLPSTV